MYKLQICDALTQEILREKMYKKPDLILSLIEFGEKGQECFLFDEQFRTFKGAYVNHHSFIEGDTEIFQMFYDLKLSEVQARVAN